MVTLRQGLTVVMPARDEEAHLRDAAQVVLDVVPRFFDSFELLIVDDGSHDRTGAIADELASRYPQVVALHNHPSRGLGGVVRQGLALAKMGSFMYVDGKGATPAAALERILSRHGEADLVIPYPVNMHERSRLRRVISWTFQRLLNVLFGLRLRYFNHLVLYPTVLLQGVRVLNDSYSFQAECIIKLLKRGASYVEVGVVDRFDLDGHKSKAFKLRNVAGVGLFLLITLWDVYIRRLSHD